MTDPNATDPVPAVPCAACAAGPSGIDGHASLWTQTIGATLFSLECRDCRTLWRRLASNGGYTWEPITRPLAGTGQLVPPRADDYAAAAHLLSRFRLPTKP